MNNRASLSCLQNLAHWAHKVHRRPSTGISLHDWSSEMRLVTCGMARPLPLATLTLEYQLNVDNIAIHQIEGDIFWKYLQLGVLLRNEKAYESAYFPNDQSLWILALHRWVFDFNTFMLFLWSILFLANHQCLYFGVYTNLPTTSLYLI